MEGSITNTVQPQGWNPAEARMSFFRKPITNKWPEREPWSLFRVYEYVRGRWAMPETEALRSKNDENEEREYKGQNFDYVTPSGVFSYCSDNKIITHSQIICMDLDYLDDRVEELFKALLEDKMLQTLLLFRSPRGHGLKWFVHIDLSRCDHATWFKAIRRYLMATYHLDEKQVDPQCGNTSRACFLCHDPEAYLMDELIEHF